MSELDLGTLRGHVELDIQDFDRKYGQVDNLLNQLERRPIPDMRVDADITGADAKLGTIQNSLDKVDAEEVTADVTADIAKAEAELDKAGDDLQRLDAERATMTVDADTSPAEAAFDDVEDAAAESGDESGRGMMMGILAGLAAIPIVGAVVKIGQSIAGGILSGIQDGLAIEATRDLFGARTGLDDATAAKFGRAAGEAYADAWGESVEANLDTARTALQAGILDADATQADAERMVASLSAVSSILEEDIQPIARATGVMLRTGMAPDAQGAFDILVRGAQTGANASEDLLDTFIEYPALFERLGLTGEEALGLINQGLQAGARNSDLVADALKEFQIRATDASEASAEGFTAIGLNAEEMTAKIAKGGEGAREGLAQVLDGLRDMEDPVARNTAGVALFGTQWEDMAGAMMALDLSTAVEELDGVAGAADRAMERLGSNAAAEIESARRNIEVAADGIKGALAAAFSDEITGAADWVQRNRGPVMEFLLDAINAAFDLGEGFLTMSAGALNGFAAIIEAAGGVMLAIDAMMPGDQGAKEFQQWSLGAADAVRGAADSMEGDWADALNDMRTRANQWAAPEIMSAHVHDAVLEMQGRMDEFSAFVDESGGTVTINGDTMTADEALQHLVGQIDESGGYVTINGETVPADEALDTLMRTIGDSEEDVTVDGDTAEARAATEAALNWIREQGSYVDVSATTHNAEAAVQAFIDRYHGKTIAQASVDVYTRLIDQGVSRGDAASGARYTAMARAYYGYDQGGYTGDLPVDDVAGVVHGREFVIDAANTREWRPILEAIHQDRITPADLMGGMTPAAAGITAPVAGGPQVLWTGNAYGLTAEDVIRAAGREFGWQLK